MNQVVMHPFSVSTTHLGFGCSSLVGRIREREAKALIDAAYDAGIRHFDVARSYGYGAAESLLAGALGNRRAEVTITSKFGLPVMRTPRLVRAARALLRPVARHLSALRKRPTSAPAAMALTLEFTVEGARQSLQTTLRELKTEYLDLFLLHEVRADVLADPRLLEFLQNAVHKGTIRGFGVGTDLLNLPALLATRAEYCPVVQHESSILTADLPLPGSAFRITHGALMRSYQRLAGTLGDNVPLARAASDAVGLDLSRSENLSGVLLRSQVLRHAGSITLFSARSTQRIAHNVQSLNDSGLDKACARLANFVTAHRESFAGRAT